MRECSHPTMCHMSDITCYVSHVRCHVSGVTCQVSCVTFSFFLFFLLLFEGSGGTSCWRVCYQRGLPRLVFNDLRNILQVWKHLNISQTYLKLTWYFRHPKQENTTEKISISQNTNNTKNMNFINIETS